jgi:hypothetical protein
MGVGKHIREEEDHTMHRVAGLSLYHIVFASILIRALE